MRTLLVLVAILSVAFAQISCDTCDNPINSLPQTIDVCQSGGIYRYTAADFNLMALGYSGVSPAPGEIRSISGGDVEGRVFANDNLLLIGNGGSNPGYSIGDKIVNNPANAPYSVKAYSAVVGGDVMWTNGQLNPVNNDSNHIIENGVYFGGSSNAPQWLRFSQCNSGNPLDITDFRLALQELSNQLHTDVATATYTVQNNGQTIVLQGGGANVCNYLLRINASDWNNHKDFMIVPSTWNIGANIIIDINCDADPMVFLDGEFPALATNVLYNFGQECEGIEIQARSVTGSILAPWSLLNQAEGRIWGNVYVGRVLNFLQINEIPCSSNPEACECCNLCFAKGKSTGSCKGDILMNHKAKL